MATTGTRRLTDAQDQLLYDLKSYEYVWVSHNALRCARTLERRGLCTITDETFGNDRRAFITDAGRAAARDCRATRSSGGQAIVDSLRRTLSRR